MTTATAIRWIPPARRALPGAPVPLRTDTVGRAVPTARALGRSIPGAKSQPARLPSPGREVVSGAKLRDVLRW